jgi:hypothetical protein
VYPNRTVVQLPAVATSRFVSSDGERRTVGDADGHHGRQDVWVVTVGSVFTYMIVGWPQTVSLGQ